MLSHRERAVNVFTSGDFPCCIRVNVDGLTPAALAIWRQDRLLARRSESSAAIIASTSISFCGISPLDCASRTVLTPSNIAVLILEYRSTQAIVKEIEREGIPLAM